MSCKPIRPEGKQIPGQGTAEFERIRSRYFIEYKPQTEHRHHLVALMASASWRLERIDLIEAAALDILMDDVPAEPTLYHKLAAGMGNPALVPEKLLRHPASRESRTTLTGRNRTPRFARTSVARTRRTSPRRT